MTSAHRALFLSSLSSLGLLIISAPAFAQEPTQPEPDVAPTTTEAQVEAPAEPVAAEPAPVEPPAPAPAAVADPEPVVEAEPKVAEVVPVVEAEAEPSLSPVKIGTHTFSRFEYRENYDKLGVSPPGNASRSRFSEGDTTVFRARLTFQTNELELGGIKGSVYFAPQASGSWGTSGAGGTVGEANVGIYEGYFKLAGEHLAFRAGRFAMNYGDALVIGNLDWHQSGRAFDGVHLSAKAGKSTIDAFFTQQAQGWPGQGGPFMAGDAFFWGIYGMFGPAIVDGLELDVYALAKSFGASNVTSADGAGGTVPVHLDAATFATIGARAKQKLGVFDYRLEADLQVGKQQAAAPATAAAAASLDSVNKFAYQGDLELGIAPVDAFRIALGGVVASGNQVDTDKNEAYDELFPTTHKWLGLMDVIGVRSNVVSANVKLQAKLGKSTGLNVDGHMFMRPEPGGLGNVDFEHKLAGFEVDAGLAQKIGKFSLVRGLYGIFIPGSDHYASNTAAHFVEIEAGLKF